MPQWSTRFAAATLIVATLGLSDAITISGVAQQKHTLWRVTAPGGGEVYLLGSLHLLSKDYYPLAGTIENAFKESTVLVTELDLDEVRNPAAMMGLVGKAMLPNGQVLKDALPPETFRLLTSKAEQLGVPAAAIARFKPWVVAMMLVSPLAKNAGFEATLGIDQHFFTRAKERGLERRALETLTEQFQMLDSLPAEDQLAFLRSTLEDADLGVAQLQMLARAWREGDTATLERSTLESFREAPELHRRLLVARNAAWVAPVARCVTEKARCFVVVGAAHLVGPDGLPGLLEKRGYTVVQQ